MKRNSTNRTQFHRGPLLLVLVIAFCLHCGAEYSARTVKGAVLLDDSRAILNASAAMQYRLTDPDTGLDTIRKTIPRMWGSQPMKIAPAG